MDIVELAQAEIATPPCGDNPSVVCETVYDWTGNETVAHIADWVVARPLTAIFILLLAYVINKVVRRGITNFIAELMERQDAQVSGLETEPEERDERRFSLLTEKAIERARKRAQQAERSKQRSQALGSVLKSLASAVIYGLATIMALAEFGISLGPLIAGAGVAGVALGFGAQTLVKDFLSGVFMLIEDQFGVGDIVDLGEAAGVVEEVSLRTTRLRDVHGTVWFVPNGEIRRVGNKSQEWARAVLDVEVAYDTNINKAMRVIKEVADSVWQAELDHATILEEPEIWGVETFGASAIAIRLVLKVEPGEQWATAREIRHRLKDAFDAEGIEIPFPQRTVWLHRVAEPPIPVLDEDEETEFHAAGAPDGTG